MKFVKILIALFLSIALLYIARTNSKGQPVFYTNTSSGITFEYTSVPKGLENSSVEVPITITGDIAPNMRAVIRRTKLAIESDKPLSRYGTNRLTLVDSTSGLYNTFIQTGERGERFNYYFEIRDNVGGVVASLTDNGQPFVFKFIGDVPNFILFGHIFLIFATVFCIAMVAAGSFPLLKGQGEVKPTARWMMWSVIICFLGGYPFGFAMNWYAFGGIWEGIPFGTDATDNKTQLLFVYIIFAMLTMLGSLRNKPEKDLYSKKSLGVVGLLSFVVMTLIYLIPHSIQFSKELTNNVCYSYTGFIVLLYLYSYWRKNKKA